MEHSGGFLEGSLQVLVGDVLQSGLVVVGTEGDDAPQERQVAGSVQYRVAPLEWPARKMFFGSMS